MGNRNGTFQTALQVPTAGYTASSVAVADLTGNGIHDIVTTNRSGNAACGYGAWCQSWPLGVLDPQIPISR
jgi:hypothetical protein